jgi:hypothetical protein
VDQTLDQPLEQPVRPIVRRPAATVLIGTVILAGLLLAILLYVAGGRAAHGQTRYPMHNVIGMKLDQAVAALRRPGATVHVTRARYGQYDVVLRATGFDIDGTYGPGSQIDLVVGGHVVPSSTSG